MSPQPDPDAAAAASIRRHPAPVGDIIAAQDAGQVAYGQGVPVDDCPYRGSSKQSQVFLATMWVKGWNYARHLAECQLAGMDFTGVPDFDRYDLDPQDGTPRL